MILYRKMSGFITKIVTPINSPVKKKKRQQLLTLNLQEELI
jgi:hypothetical protein